MKSFLFACVIATLAGCSAEEEPVARDELVAVRGATFDQKDYVARNETYRLMGVEPGDGTLPRSAIVANTKSWSTKTLREGDLLGRSARVSTIDERGVSLVDARGVTLRLETGRDIELRVTRHRLDVVATAIGKHRQVVDVAAATAALAEHGMGASSEEVELWEKPALRLSELDPEGVMAKSGFHELDLVVSLDGEPAGPGTLKAIVAKLANDGNAKVGIVRAGTPMELVFSPR